MSFQIATTKEILLGKWIAATVSLFFFKIKNEKSLMYGHSQNSKLDKY